jgi:hypothetical protein
MFFIQFGICGPDEKPLQEEGNALHEIINNYKDEGYSIIGPLQVTKVPSRGVVCFYKHKPVKYHKVNVVNDEGQKANLDKYDRVYLIQKNRNIILIKLSAEDKSNV